MENERFACFATLKARGCVGEAFFSCLEYTGLEDMLRRHLPGVSKVKTAKLIQN